MDGRAAPRYPRSLRSREATLMAWPARDMAAGEDRGRLRTSHADRDRVVETLKAAYVYGLVTKEEFDTRVGQTLAARTYAELSAITADIPAGLAPAPPPLSPAPAQASPAAHVSPGPGDRAFGAMAALAVLLFAVACFASDAMTPVLLLGALVSAFVSLSARHCNRSGRQQPPEQKVRGGPGARRRVGSAAPSEWPLRTSKPWRPGSAQMAPRHSLRPGRPTSRPSPLTFVLIGGV
jgi:hypothetical protein